MPALTIKNIPDHLYDALKNASRQNHRSINSEILVCIERALLPRRITMEERLGEIQRLRTTIPAEAITVDEITRAINEGRP
uniref:Arc-like DNA binding domain-containing protein n=1 Tax=Candidatus Kentrum sp. FM TaxID=2126340 RepID=A0A450SP99_9GAMM|nr:MAG: Arc-like DNA binding domain-containing protein [Candidatus Kentron sp. FM]VFJ55648.1 MAG: Arc-like DNA binding domain-containing protein [Candidatus Kentron sp. FM]VFK10772.1 MAG: Arc-like DNA binding domain-containing protein [Candidatus Kentron sp. FM]